MNAIVSPGVLTGQVTAPASKSDAHRALIVAALCKGASTLHGVGRSQDIEATIDGLRALGAAIEWDKSSGETIVQGVVHPPKTALIDCRESGSTLRFLLPVAAALGINTTFFGTGRLPSRPIAPLAEALCKGGATITNTDVMPITVSGALKPGEYSIPGNLSSQFVSGLLLGLQCLEGPSVVNLSTALESEGYVGMTTASMARFGAPVRTVGDSFLVPGGGYKSCEYTVEGDYSGAAFWLCAGAMGSGICCRGLSPASLQADAALLPLLASIGCNVSSDAQSVTVTPKHPLKPFSLDASHAPDLVPILAILAGSIEGESVLYNAGRARLKECDRLSAMACCLKALGVSVTEEETALTIRGGKFSTCGEIDGQGDHRIVMAAAIGALFSDGNTTITNAEAVSKSYPRFFSVLRELGGVVDGI